MTRDKARDIIGRYESPLTVAVAREKDAVLVSLSGPFTFETAPQLREALKPVHSEAQGKRFIIDITNVRYVDSAGLATLVEAFGESRARGAKLVLAGPSAGVRGVLRLSALDKVFTVYPSVEQALAEE